MNHESVFEVTIQQPIKMLQNLSGFLEKATQHAKAKKIEMEVLLQSRLIADQFPLMKQIQSSCDVAKLCGFRLTGKEAPKHPDTEKTYPEIQQRIKDTVSYLQTLKADDFKGYESKKIEFPWNPGKYLTGKDYVTQFAVPNFYFHVTTAYSILRHNGVDLGKGDFLGNLPFQS